MEIRRYPSKPLECWEKAKELRLNHYLEIARAREEGKLVVTGGAETPQPLLAGLGPYVYLAGEPYGAAIAHVPHLSMEYMEAVEGRGFARDLCAYMRNYWGSMFLNQYFFGGPFPKPDFCLQLHFCDSHGKWFQLVSEHFGVPLFVLDYPFGRKTEDRVEYLASQMHDAIEWMEKVVGRKYNDELFIEAVRNECLSSSLWGEIMLLNQNIPAPLDIKSIFSLYIITVLMRDTKEAVEFNKLLLAEVEERVREGIAAVATERCRLIDDAQPPWHFLHLYRYLEKYGAAVVASYYSIFLGGNLGLKEDGSWGRAKTPEERGWSLKTREDAVRAFAHWYIERPIFESFFMPQTKAALHLKIYREWKGNGVIIHLNRGCEGMCMGSAEVRLILLESGIPVVAYEGNMGDRRELNEAQVLDRIDSFMESLGLKKLE